MTKPPDQLSMTVGDRDADLLWMRAAISERKLKDVTDHHLVLFWEHARGDRKMAVEAIASIHEGKPYEPLRRLMDVTREPSS